MQEPSQPRVRKPGPDLRECWATGRERGRKARQRHSLWPHGDTRHWSSTALSLTLLELLQQNTNWGCFNGQNLFLAVLEAGSPRSRCQLMLLLGMPASGLQTATPHADLTGQREHSLSLRVPSFSSEDTNPIMGTPPSQTHQNRITSQRPISKSLHIGGQGLGIQI